MSSFVLSKLNSSHIDEISEANNDPAWLKEYRKNAFTIFQQLPPEVSPLYNKYSDANKMDPEQIMFSLSSDSTIPDFVKDRLVEIGNNPSIVQIGTSIHKINIPSELKEKGLVMCSIQDAIKNYGDKIKKSFEQTDSKRDKYIALNNAFFNSGIFIYVPRNLVLEKTIHLVSSLSLDQTSTISRNVIVAEDNSKSSIVQEIYAPHATKQQAYLELLDVTINPNSQFDLVTLQAMDETAVNFSSRVARIERDGRMNWYLGLFGSHLSRYKVDNFLNGQGATAQDTEVVFGNKNQSYDLASNLIHNAPSTIGRVLEKSVLKDTAKSLFKGMIRIEKDAHHAESYLSGHSILLDKGAKSDSIPGLEIFTNDVKATHSASVAQMDEEQIFYLATRCLNKSDAQKIIVEGFLEPLSRKMSYQVRAWISYLIDSKWAGRNLTIKTDEQLKAMLEVEETRYRETDTFESHYKYR
ncbi:SufB/SufD family protein [Candidatus Nitrosotalea okcheonensis]|uniref:ABC-type transport system involved in Fe-S cluster assembly, permease component n=1 Tax=Candidatus Nitrosotalea okcheonensis TaxID=1903276 RepID=A0A2H1FBT2_9ARCH|nr:SufD family Fe-S cluster assembly protein [Candidatus Nitrosotalea okcheonensis]SMH70224.1 ABC-type transport system involved in Fe-S cluster assembly, permease component [Candidatus Nitrosotalea okcheonensis]